MDTRLYVCTHKEFTPPSSSLYIPLHVGRAISDELGYLGDDTGDNISGKNRSFCELTGIYWIWKNVQCDIVGICHYRRYFVESEDFLTKESIESVIRSGRADIIVPSSAWTPYKSNQTHYQKIHHIADYNILRDVISEKYPEYIPAFDFFSKTNLASSANMVITKKEIFDEYCRWLFDILFEVEKRTDISDYDSFQYRLYGYLSERMFRMWLMMHEYKVREFHVREFDASVSFQGRLVFMTGVLDTLDIFTYDLIRAFSALGYECFEFNTSNMAESLGKLSVFLQKPTKAVITFNNLGFNMELSEGENIWETLGIPCINILMNHPFHHKKALDEAPQNAVILCPDKNHMKYVQRYYPTIPVTGFLPHGGNAFTPSPLPLKERSIDLIYAGGISTPFIKKAMPDFSQFPFNAKSIGDEAFCMMQKNPSMTTESSLEKCLLAHKIVLSDAELCDFIEKMKYVDMKIVSYFREKTVRTLVEAGINVTLYGTGWDDFPWMDAPNLNFCGRARADEIVHLMGDTKIVLSTMTWFKDGTHDRVYNGMLQGALVISDTSVYMKENYPYYPKNTMEESLLAMFELDQIEALPSMVCNFLNNLDMSQIMADNGRRHALVNETWDHRAKELHQDLLK